jgi:hypothetical protein
MEAEDVETLKAACKRARYETENARKIERAASMRFDQIDSPVRRSTQPLLPDGTAVTDLGLAAAKEALGIARAALAAAKQAEQDAEITYDRLVCGIDRT